MQFTETFVPTAREVGLLPIVTEQFLVIALFSFAAGFVFFLTTRQSVAPWHRTSNALSAVICLVAGASYWFIHHYYHDMAHALAALPDPVARKRLIHDSYFALGEYRYMDWAVTTPLLLLKMVLMLKVEPREVLGTTAVLLGADFLMVITGAIGDQQFAPNGDTLVGAHLFWGSVSTLFYLVIPSLLFVRLSPRYGGRADDPSGRAFRLLALTTVTTWGVYPLGYLVPVVFPHSDLNWVHLAFTVADVVNKIGVGVVAYLAGAQELEERVPRESVQKAWLVG